MDKKQLEKHMKEKSFPKRIKMSWAPETYTEGDMIRAFVQGFIFHADQGQKATALDVLAYANELLDQGKLGKENQ